MGESKKLKLHRKNSRPLRLENRMRSLGPSVPLSSIVDIALEPSIVTDSSSNIIAVNDQVCRLSGRHRDELLGLSLNSLIQLPVNAELAGASDDKFNPDVTGRLTGISIMHKTGSSVRASAISRRVDTDAGQVTVTNILTGPQEGKKTVSTLLNTAPFAYHSLDDQGCMIDVNQTWLDKMGLSREEVIGRWFGDFLLPDYVEFFSNNFPRFKQKGHTDRAELGLRSRNGTELIGSFECRAVYDEQGSFAYSHCTFRDITEQKTMETALSESEERFRILAELSPDAICVHFDGKIGFVNRAAVRLLGASSPEQLLGREVWDFVHPDYLQVVTERLARIRDTGESLDFIEQKVIRLDGCVVDVETSSAPLPYNGNKAVQVVARDITERKTIVKALQSSEKRYRAIVQEQTDLVCRWTPDGILTFVNDSYARYFGKTADELIGSSFMSLIPETEHQRIEDHFRSFEPDEPLQVHEHRVLAADGELRWQQWTNRGSFDGDGRLVEVMSVGRDITKLKQTEEALQYRLDFEQIVTSLSSRFFSIAPEEMHDNVVDVLRTIGAFTGADRCYVFRLSEDGKTMSNTHEWCADEVIPYIEKLQNLPTDAYAYLLNRMHREGLFHVPRVADLPAEAAVEKAEFERENIKSIICVPMFRWEKLIGFTGFDSVKQEKVWSADEIALLKIVGDMLTTALEREKTERALRASEERYRTFVEGFQGIAYKSRMNWIPLFFHGAVESITGYTEQEFVAGNPRWDQIIHPDDWDSIRESVHKVAAVPNYTVDREYRIIRKDGEIRWVREMSRNTCNDAGQPDYVQGAIYDITEQRLTAQALRKSEERFRTVADFTYDWEYWMGIDGRCIYVTPSCESTTGYTAEEFQKDSTLLRSIVHPDDLPLMDQHFHDAVEKGRVTSIDFRIITRSGDQRWINHVCQQVYGDEGKYLGRRASNRDITDRKAAEEAVRQERDRAQRYLDVAGTILLAVGADGKVILVNRKGSEVLDCDEIEIVGRDWFDNFVPAKERSSARDVFERMMNGDEKLLEYHESPVWTRKGKVRMIAWYNTILRDEDGKIKGTLSSGLDITERKWMEKVQATLFEISEATNLSQNLEELLETVRAILGKLIDTTNFYVALYDELDDTYTFPYIVDQYNETSPSTPEQLKKTLTDYVRRTGLPLLADGVVDKELEAAGEVDVVGRPSEVWLGVPLKTPRGVLGVVAVQSYTDPTLYKESDMDLMTFVSGHITMAIERKLADDALRQSEQQHRSLVETMSEGLVAHDNDGFVTFANKRFCEMLGVTRQDVIGSTLRELLDDQNREIMSDNSKERKEGVYVSYELEWQCSDGSTITTIVSPEAIRDADNRVLGSFSVITDISDWKRAEAKLRQATELLRTEREALTQKNIALKEILEHIEKERQDYKQNICQDVQRAVAPFFQKLKTLTDTGRERELETLEVQLDAILARDVDSYRGRYATLTPRELEICELIKAKRTSKEMSERLNLSLLTVHKHREQIRRKLGLTSKNINLSTYLQSH